MARIIGRAGNPRSQTSWGGSIDAQGYRTYKIEWLIQPDAGDGPANVLSCPGLPAPGSPWVFDSDVDLWVWCRYEMSCKPLVSKQDRPEYYVVEQTFSNKPDSQTGGNRQGCQDAKIDDPILQPQKVSGSFIKKQVEAAQDRFGNPLVTSSWEQLRGANVEFDDDTDQVRIEQNVLDLDFATVEGMKNTVNAYTLWGMPPRTVKLSEFTWDRQTYGQCYVYYTRKFTFDANLKTFDKLALDEGTKALQGHWDARTGFWVDDPIATGTGIGTGAGSQSVPPNPANPQHFMRFVDRQGNTARVILDGNGRPWDPRLNDTIDTCGLGQPMPRYWQVTNTDVSWVGSFNNQRLAYSGGCTWSAGGITLTFVQPDPEEEGVWFLEDTDGGLTYELLDSQWEDLGPNTMHRADGFGPESILLTQAESRFGFRYIQYYNESDFLRLGIPLIL